MFLFEIGLLNGFTVDVDEERERNKGARMVELDDDSVNVYFDQVKIFHDFFLFCSLFAGLFGSSYAQ